MTQVLAARGESEDYNVNPLPPPQPRRHVKEDYESELWEGVRKELWRMVDDLVHSKNHGGGFSTANLAGEPTETLSKEEMLELLTTSYDSILNDEMKDFINSELERGKCAIRDEAAGLQKAAKEELEIEKLKFLEMKNHKEEKLKALEHEVKVKVKDLERKTERYKAQISDEIRTIEESQRQLDGDLLLQLYLFPQKSLTHKAALIGAVVLSNQLIYQILQSQPWKGGGGSINPLVICGMIACILGGALFYFDTGRS